jgi:hypothetical protein
VNSRSSVPPFVTLIGVGIRLLVMMTVQQWRQRMNRQIDEQLRT